LDNLRLGQFGFREFPVTFLVRLLTMALFHVAPRAAADFPQWSLWRRKGTALRRRRPPCGGLSLRCAVTRNAAAEKREEYTSTSAPGNEMTEAGQELLGRPVMEPLSPTERERTMASTNEKKHYAALVRWSKQRAAGGQRPERTSGRTQ